MAKASGCADNVKDACGLLLAFDDMEHFQQVYACLEAEYEAHNDAFEATWGYLPDDDFNAMSDQLGFYDEQPLIDFEQALSFHSFRKMMEAQEDSWLATGADPTTYPGNGNNLQDEVLETLFNEAVAVKIGDVIYYIAPDGTEYEILNGNCELLECIQANPECAVGDSNVVINKGGVVECRNEANEEDWVQYNNGTRKYWYGLNFDYLGFWDHTSRVKGQIKTYQLKNGNWKRHKTDLKITLFGATSPYDEGKCDDTDAFNESKGWKKRRKLTCHWWYAQPGYVRAAETDVITGEMGFGGSYNPYTLDW